MKKVGVSLALCYIGINHSSLNRSIHVSANRILHNFRYRMLRVNHPRFTDGHRARCFNISRAHARNITTSETVQFSKKHGFSFFHYFLLLFHYFSSSSMADWKLIVEKNLNINWVIFFSFKIVYFYFYFSHSLLYLFSFEFIEIFCLQTQK